MNDQSYYPPKFEEKWFTCPHCWTYSQQEWYELEYGSYPKMRLSWFYVSICAKCEEKWIRSESWELLWPYSSTAPMPNPDMPEEVKNLYEEARSVADLSPRAAAALLRVSIEKLTECLWEKEWNLNTRIHNLKEKWLPEKVIQSFDILRVTWNEWWSHLGQIDLAWNDNKETVDSLFLLVNIIVERVISNNNQVDELYKKLPKDKLDWIKNRDK